MQKGIYIVMGQLTVKEFIEALFETQRKPPAFAMPAWAEAVISFETLNKRHTNPDEGGFANGYRAFGISLLNAAMILSTEAVHEQTLCKQWVELGSGKCQLANEEIYSVPCNPCWLD